MMNQRIRSYLTALARASDSMRRADADALAGHSDDIVWHWYDDVRLSVETAKALLQPDDEEPCKAEREMLETRARLMLDVYATGETQ